MTKQARIERTHETDLAWYKLGLEEGERKGEHQLDVTIALLMFDHEQMTASNIRLWEQLLHREEIDPMGGVKISKSFANDIIKALRRPDGSDVLAKKLEDKLKNIEIEVKL